MEDSRPKTITFYCGDSAAPWGPRSLWQGVGGSEEALIHMTFQLRDRGWQVAVYGRPPAAETGMRDGVAWHAYDTFQPDRGGDVFVAWRQADFLPLGKAHDLAFHWLHNHQEWPYQHDLAALADRVLVVSEHHANDEGFSALGAGKVFVTRNGLDPEFLCEPGDNEPARAIYASCPARGLLTVLEMWPEVRRRVPHAQLDVFHGFTPVYEEMARLFPGLTWVKGEVLARVDQPGVTFHGMVGQDRLAQAFAQAGVWLYPTETDETSCITAMKALAMGALPVTSGLGALTETLAGRELGPADSEQPISHSRWRMWRFRRRVVQLMKQGHRSRYRKRRLAWAAWARERYAWPAIADEWCQLFNEVAAEKKLAW